MKAVVTGGHAGLGLDLSNHLESKGYQVFKYSLENDYNITTDYKKIAMMSYDCDLFVNCAYDRETDSDAQVQLLHELYAMWRTQHKLIINIGSIGAHLLTDRGLYGLTKFKYRSNKNALMMASHQYSNRDDPCMCTIINPEFFESEQTQFLQEQNQQFNIMDKQKILDMFVQVLDWRDQGTHITSVTIKKATDE